MSYNTLSIYFLRFDDTYWSRDGKGKTKDIKMATSFSQRDSADFQKYRLNKINGEQWKIVRVDLKSIREEYV